ncbi:hypothetical protein [Chitinophaga vietnamensis]|uniref:hypothetical protein n=1 Tax=Chitinophaga vietnamensis TaxID=2593957 RepID=UPI0011773CBA|nr:hypothetical protein [Chitinophaga vietnamensis]
MFFKKNIYYDFAKHVTAGPDYVEDFFSSQVGVGSNRSEHYQKFLETLRDNEHRIGKKHDYVIPFLTGYFHQQLAIGQENVAIQRYHTDQALTAFNDFLSSQKGERDLQYFAKWQTGELLQQLDTPWPEVEQIYLATLELDTARGEAIRNIIQMYYAMHEWRIAYIYSSYFMAQLQGKPPVDTRKWFIDTAFYHWKILEFHLPLCLTLRKKDEARKAYEMLMRYTVNHQEWFTADDLERFRNYQLALIQNKGGVPNIIAIPKA